MTANEWSPGSEPDDEFTDKRQWVDRVEMSFDGDLFIGGSFTLSDSVCRTAKWDGGKWVSLD